MDTKERKIPGADHPITVEPAATRMLVRVAGRVIADSTRTLELREAAYPVAYYFPLEDVEQSLLGSSDTHTYCPYKGEASYYSITLPDGEDPDGRMTDAIWTYPEPYPAVAPIAGHVAFYPDRVQITAEDA